MSDRDGEDQAFVDAISEWPDINDGPPTLAGFLLARITEDEYAASLTYETCFVGTLDPKVRGSRYDLALRMSPARVLAECEAKRRIVDPESFPGHMTGSGTFHDSVLRLLALPYADHPDYQEAWRP